MKVRRFLAASLVFAMGAFVALKADAATSLACVTGISNTGIVKIRVLHPDTGGSQIRATVGNVDSLSTSAVARKGSQIYFIGRTSGALSDQLIIVNLDDGTKSVVTLDVGTFNTLFFKGTQLKGFVSNDSNGNEEYRDIDPLTGATTLISTISGFETAQLGAFARDKNGSRILHISNNSDGSQTLYSIKVGNGQVVSSVRIRTAANADAEVEKLKRIAHPHFPTAAHAGVYQDNLSGEVRFLRVRSNGKVFKNRLLPLDGLVDGHTLVTNGLHLYVLGTKNGSNSQFILQVDQDGAVVRSVALRNNAHCAMLKFGKTSEPD